MSIGASISVIAVGAILAFATHVHSQSVSLIAMGGVLMVVGIVALGLQIAALHRQRQLTAAEVQSPERSVVVRPPSER